MIGKLIKGKDFQRCLRYVLGKADAVLLGSNMVAQTPDEFATEFEEIRCLRPALTRMVCHCALSLNPGEYLDDANWNELTRRYLERMGAGNTQYLLVRHQDTGDRDHVHIIWNRVCFDGSVVSDRWDHLRSRAAIRDLEAEYHLTPTAPAWSTEQRTPTRRQMEKERETGQVTVQARLQHLLEQTLAQSPLNFSAFRDRLAGAGVEMRLHCDRHGSASGISFALEGVALSGSQLGRAYSLPRLLQRMELMDHPTSLAKLLPEVSFFSTRRQLQQTIQTTLEEVESLPALMEHLEQLGIAVHLKYASTRRERPRKLRGIAYSLNGITLLGEALGDASSLPALQSSFRAIAVPPQSPTPHNPEVFEQVQPTEESPIPDADEPAAELPQRSTYQALYEQLALKFQDDVSIAAYLLEHGNSDDMKALIYSPEVRRRKEIGMAIEAYLREVLQQAQMRQIQQNVVKPEREL